MTAFKEILIGGYVLRFWPSDNGWMCGITESMMDALAQQVVSSQRTWVGLTVEEKVLELMFDAEGRLLDYEEYANAIEAKLKDKNGF